MKILWLCNIVPPIIAAQLGLDMTNKEGWISGLMAEVLRNAGNNRIDLAIASPLPARILKSGSPFLHRTVSTDHGELAFFGFAENVQRPERYDPSLEAVFMTITRIFDPDIVHCFGTEYPHTLAMCRAFPQKDRLLLGIQGLCAICADAYFADLPECVIHSSTFRDLLKRDGIRRQREKFRMRGEHEIAAVRLAGNITGRTDWDRHYTHEWNPSAIYHKLNETLRPAFYTENWNCDQCIPHSIFLSQGDYPLKGLHYMLAAMPRILQKYPDTHLFIAGNSIAEYKTLRQKLKISAYGKYLRKLLSENSLESHVTFLGKLSAPEMKHQYLRSHLFVCCSSLENSPNSLGEAMLLGIPCVSADVGGIPSIFTDGKDGILYSGFRPGQNGEFNEVSQRLADACTAMWDSPEQTMEYCRNARAHALVTHDPETNYRRLLEIYQKISQRSAP